MSVVVIDNESVETMIQDLDIILFCGNARCINEIVMCVNRCMEILRNSPHNDKEETLVSLKEADEIGYKINRIRRTQYAMSEPSGVTQKVADRLLENLYWFLFHKVVS